MSATMQGAGQPVFNVRFPSLEKFEKELTENISKGGFYLRTQKPKPLRTKIEVRFHLPGKDEPVPMEGEVVQVVTPEQQDQVLKAGMAVQFCEFDENTVQWLQEILQECKSAEASETPQEQQTDDDRQEEEEEEDEFTGQDQSNIFAAVRSKSIHEKVSLAKRANRSVRNVLIQEGNKQVMRFILQNPKLTAQEVVQILKMPYINMETIQTIAKDGRWSQNEDIRYHIVISPKTPLPTALNVLNSLNVKNLALVAKSRHVKAQVKSNALKLLEKRRGGGT